MEALQRFVESPSGSVAYSMARHYGTDPVGFLSDDVLALNVRAALMVAHAGPEPDSEPEPTFEEKFS